MVELNEQEILAEIRTLLALERNYLAEERTALSEFRTGLTLALIAPPASALVAQIIPILPIEVNFLFDAVIYTIFAILTIIGIWMSIRSRSKLKKITKQKKILKDREAEVARRSKVAYDLIYDLLDLEDSKKSLTENK